jgi:ketosteroid isomerase-like protein
VREEIQRLLRGIDAFNRRDFRQAVANFREDAEWHAYLSALQRRVSRGPHEVESMLRDLTETFEGFHVEAEEVVDLGDLVVVTMRASGRAGADGPTAEQRWAQLYTLRDGLIARVEPFTTKKDALAEAERRKK